MCVFLCVWPFFVEFAPAVQEQAQACAYNAYGKYINMYIHSVVFTSIFNVSTMGKFARSSCNGYVK